jgi:glycosyltransferase involved in cell wall biosynthesis
LGEKLGGVFANEVIVISRVIEDIIKRRAKRNSNLIYNGVNIPANSTEKNYLDKLGVEPGNYILAVARFVPEKGLHDLINAFNSSHIDKKLVIAGDADHEDSYSRNLKGLAAKNSNIVLTGYIGGEELNQVYSHASFFVLPSYHEGLPIALLEAMSYGLPTLVSDIPANKEVDLPKEFFFKCGNVDELKEKLDFMSGLKFTADQKEQLIQKLSIKYNWDKIADQTIAVYEKVVNGGVAMEPKIA